MSLGLLCVLCSTLCLLGSLGLLCSLAGSLLLGSLCSLGSLGSLCSLEACSCCSSELVGEALDTSAGVDELLLARVERVALVAQVDDDLALRGAGLERVAAGAANGALHVLRMNTLLHGRTPLVGLVSDQTRGYGPDCIQGSQVKHSTLLRA